jgi:hypothetical protein
MIRVLILDFDDTLVHGGDIIPHACEALDSISGFETASGEPLAICLVSDFEMTTPPSTGEKISTAFKDFVSILDGFNLKGFFEPVSRRVTLSSHAGIKKPDRRVFETAIGRLGVKAGLEECMFITGNRDYISECKKLGISTLRFDYSSSRGGDFSDWSQAPLLIAKLVAPYSDVNLKSALTLYLANIHDVNLTFIEEGASSKDKIHARAKTLFQVSDPRLGIFDGIHMELPVDLSIQLGEGGEVKSLKITEPSSRDISEAKHYLKSLIANKQVSLVERGLSGRATHQVEIDSKGRRVLTRKRFTAV